MKSTFASIFLGLLLLLLQGSNAFTTSTLPYATSTSSTCLFARSNLDKLEDVGYYVNVQKPLGVVFEENVEPYLGIKAADVEVGSEGSRVGIRVGDQLMAVNGDICIGDVFDSALSLLIGSPPKMKLLLYRGNVRDLYKIMDKRGVELEGGDDESEVVIMDENYESPVQVEIVESEGFSWGRAFSRLAGVEPKEEEEEEEYYEPAPEPKKKSGGFFGMFEESNDKQEKYVAPAPEPVPEPVQPKKKGGGLFGMFGESIQLEGKDAKGTGR